jgi:hypothetical protein
LEKKNSVSTAWPHSKVERSEWLNPKDEYNDRYENKEEPPFK